MKKILTLLLSFLFLFSLCACSTAVLERVVGKTEFIISGLIPTSSNNAKATAYKNGAKLAADELNNAGGVNGFRFNLLWFDTLGTEEGTAKAFNQLRQKNTRVMLALFSENEGSILGASSDNTPLIYSGTDDSLQGAPHAFRLELNASKQALLICDCFATAYPDGETAILYSGNDSESILLSAACLSRQEQDGLIPSALYDTADGVAEAYRAIIRDGNDAVFLAVSQKEARMFCGMCDAKSPLAVYASVRNDAVKKDFFLPYLYTVTAKPDAEPSPAAIDFSTAYHSAYHTDPDVWAAKGYDAVYSVVMALRAGNISSASFNAESFNDNFCNALQKATVNGALDTFFWSDREATLSGSIQ